MTTNDVYMKRSSPFSRPVRDVLTPGKDHSREAEFLEQCDDIYEDVVEATEEYDLPELDMAKKLKMSLGNMVREPENSEEVNKALEKGYKMDSGSMEIAAGEELENAMDAGRSREDYDESGLYITVSYTPPGSDSGSIEARINFSDDQPQELGEDVANVMRSYGLSP